MYSRKTHLKGNMDRFPGCSPTNLAVSKLCNHRRQSSASSAELPTWASNTSLFFHLNLLVESYSIIVLISAFLLGNNIIQTSFVLFHHSSNLSAHGCSRFGGSVCHYQKNTVGHHQNRNSARGAILAESEYTTNEQSEPQAIYCTKNSSFPALPFFTCCCSHLKKFCQQNLLPAPERDS